MKANGEIISTIPTLRGETVFARLTNMHHARFDYARASITRYGILSKTLDVSKAVDRSFAAASAGSN